MAQIAVLDLEKDESGLLASVFSAGLEVERVSSCGAISSAAQLVLIHSGPRISAAEEACWQLRDELPELPVVTAAAGEHIGDASRLLAAGACDHIRLPVHPQDLGHRLQAHLAYARRLRAHDDALSAQGCEAPPEAPLLPEGLCQQLAAAIPYPVVAADNEGRLLYLNQAMAQLLGSTTQQAMERYLVSDFIAHFEDVARLEQTLTRGPARPASLDVRIRTALGDQIPMRVYGAPARNEKGQVVATVSLLQDMREINTLTQRLEETTQQLIGAEMRASASTGSRDLAHQLNQPLTVAMGTLELMESLGDLPETALTRLERIYQQLERMADFIRRLPRDHQGGG